MTIKTIFLDRDGVINKEVGYLNDAENFKFIYGIFNSCIYFQRLGYKIVIVTNQSGIGRGFYSEKEYQTLTQWMLKKFVLNKINILDIFHCPHSPKSDCNCRKPKPGLFLQAKLKYNINMKESWMIGDKEEDIVAANRAGISNTILLRSGHKIDEKNSNAHHILNSIKNSKTVILR